MRTTRWLGWPAPGHGALFAGGASVGRLGNREVAVIRPCGDLGDARRRLLTADLEALVSGLPGGDIGEADGPEGRRNLYVDWDRVRVQCPDREAAGVWAVATPETAVVM